MPIYKITFTPSGPYFFGNEKSFAFDTEKKSAPIYFIKGEKMPYQTTLFGSLRYMLLHKKGFRHLNDEENIEAVGKASFNIEHNEATHQEFGCIKQMSAVLLCRGDELFIPTPFDHNANSDDKNYTPFTEYEDIKSRENQDAFYPIEYKAKKGISDSFMSLADMHLETDLFTTDVRIGINRKNVKDGFFKREFICLKKGFSFCVFAKIDNDKLNGKNDIVTMGQTKIPFAVKFESLKDQSFDLTEYVKNTLKQKSVCKKRIYCISDTLACDNLYNNHHFAIVKTRDFRNLKTSGSGFFKDSHLHHLISAGSVFFPKDNVSHPSKDTNEYKNAEIVGFNQIAFIEGEV